MTVYHENKAEEELNKRIDETLARYTTQMGNSSDGFDILRWAAQGRLARKIDNPKDEEDPLAYYSSR